MIKPRSRLRAALRWTGIVLGTLALALGGLTIGGLFIPREHRASASAVIAAPPERVFRALTDVERFPSWRAEVRAVEVVSRDPLRWRELGDDPIGFEVVERVEGRRFVTRIVGDDLPFGGTWSFELEPRGSGTRVSIAEEGWIGPPPLRVIVRYVIGYDATARGYLDALRAHLE